MVRSFAVLKFVFDMLYITHLVCYLILQISSEIPPSAPHHRRSASLSRPLFYLGAPSRQHTISASAPPDHPFELRFIVLVCA